MPQLMFGYGGPVLGLPPAVLSATFPPDCLRARLFGRLSSSAVPRTACGRKFPMFAVTGYTTRDSSRGVGDGVEDGGEGGEGFGLGVGIAAALLPWQSETLRIEPGAPDLMPSPCSRGHSRQWCVLPTISAATPFSFGRSEECSH